MQHVPVLRKELVKNLLGGRETFYLETEGYHTSFVANLITNGVTAYKQYVDPRRDLELAIAGTTDPIVKGDLEKLVNLRGHEVLQYKWLQMKYGMQRPVLEKAVIALPLQVHAEVGRPQTQRQLRAPRFETARAIEVIQENIEILREVRQMHPNEIS